MKDFKVRCLKTDSTREDMKFTVGKIYTPFDGYLYDDLGRKTFICEIFEHISCLRKYEFELVHEPQPFTKDMLKTGMRVKTRDGIIYVVFKEIGRLSSGKWWLGLSQLNNNLTGSDSCNVIEVYDIPNCPSDLINVDKLGELIWQRPEPKHYTKSEAIARLSEIDGQPVEIGE